MMTTMIDKELLEYFIQLSNKKNKKDTNNKPITHNNTDRLTTETKEIQ